MRRVGSHEAKTHLPPLLYEVARGETITITKRGVPVAILKPASEHSGVHPRQAVEGLRAFRRLHRLDGLTARELIDEGRR
jgi:prevent-host-death family protein